MESVFKNMVNSKRMNHINLLLTCHKDQSQETCCSLRFVYLLHVEKYKKALQKDKIRVIALAWNDEFELPGGSNSVPDIQYQIKCIIKET